MLEGNETRILERLKAGSSRWVDDRSPYRCHTWALLCAFELMSLEIPLALFGSSGLLLLQILLDGVVGAEMTLVQPSNSEFRTGSVSSSREIGWLG